MDTVSILITQSDAAVWEVRVAELDYTLRISPDPKRHGMHFVEVSVQGKWYLPGFEVSADSIVQATAIACLHVLRQHGEALVGLQVYTDDTLLTSEIENLLKNIGESNAD